MYLRFIALLGLFNRHLMSLLALPFLVLAGWRLGWLDLVARPDAKVDEVKRSLNRPTRSNWWPLFSSRFVLSHAVPRS